MTEAALLLAILTGATSFGLWRRRTDGRMRPVQPAAVDGPAVYDPGVAHHAVSGPGRAAPATSADALTEVDLGAPLGERATLVQFSSAFCQPCRATRVVLGDVADRVPGVAHVELDAESNLPLVRRLDVTRTPTVLILDAAGRIHRRATGAPRKADVIAVVGELA
ncbi:MAG: thioredoxin family protein [Candidatus Nanopelagicales bacterium]